jgi:hypothetical protein
MNQQLLCTFTPRNYVISTLRSILETYIILYNKIFIYENCDDRQQFLCTYNIDGVLRPKCYLPNTISVHRKKQSNTIYTINALNELIRECNNGILDVNFIVDWDLYNDYAFIITDGEFKKIKIKYKEVFYVKEKGENFAV